MGQVPSAWNFGYFARFPIRTDAEITLKKNRRVSVLRGRENPPSHFLPEDAMPESRSAITHAMPKSSTVCIALGLGLLLLPLIPFAANGQTCMDCRASFGCEQKDRQCANSCKAYQFGSAARNACNKNCIVVVKSCMDAANTIAGSGVVLTRQVIFKDYPEVIEDNLLNRSSTSVRVHLHGDGLAHLDRKRDDWAGTPNSILDAT